MSAQTRASQSTIRLSHLISLLGIGALLYFSGEKLANRLLFELMAPLNWDAPIYWAMGQGLLNGLLPYRDLIEAKPPGIFAVSALAQFSGSPEHGWGIAQTAVLAGLFFTPLLAFSLQKNVPPSALILGALAIIPSAALLTLFCAERAGNFQVESFGSCFISAYAAVISVRASEHRDKRSWKILAILTALLLAGIGFKEPFALIAAAAAIILCSNFKQFIDNFLLPLLFSLGVGTGVLAALGILDDYLLNYVGDMFGSHLYRYNSSSLFERGILIAPIKGDIFAFSSSMFWLLCFLASISVFDRNNASSRIWVVIMTQLAKLALAMYLTCLAVGAGGSYFGHHFAFAVPVYFALLLATLRVIFRANQVKRPWQTIAIGITSGVVSLTALCGILNLHSPDYHAQATDLRRWSLPARAAAKTIDTILSRCQIDRYQFIGHNGPQPYGYTQHSPLGPLFYFDNVWLDESHSRFQNYLLNQLQEADIVVIDFKSAQLGAIQEQVTTILKGQFASTPWECAKDLEAVPEPYAVLFRIRS